MAVMEELMGHVAGSHHKSTLREMHRLQNELQALDKTVGRTFAEDGQLYRANSAICVAAKDQCRTSDPASGPTMEFQRGCPWVAEVT